MLLRAKFQGFTGFFFLIFGRFFVFQHSFLVSFSSFRGTVKSLIMISQYYSSDSFSISMYLSLLTLAGFIFINFLDLIYFITKTMTMNATHTKIINATNNPLQRILSDRADESRQTHANDLLSFSHGSVSAATVAK